jgi:voltage-gated potassium channel Kch
MSRDRLGFRKSFTEGRFLSLLVFLLLFIVLHPFLEGVTFGKTLLEVLLVLTLISAVYAMSYKRRTFYIALVLGAPGLIYRLVQVFRPEAHLFALWAVVTAVPFLIFVTVISIHYVMSSEEVTADTLYGASAVYLLVGLTFGMAFTVIAAHNPGAFHFALAGEGSTWGDYVYFSFVTLTTLGFGDIIPASSLTRSLAFQEAVFGVLYTTVLVARLVGIFTSQKIIRRDQGQDREAR